MLKLSTSYYTYLDSLPKLKDLRLPSHHVCLLFSSLARVFSASHSNSPFVEASDIGHKDTLLIIPPFHPQSSLKAGDQYKGKDVILGVKIWPQDLDT